MQIMEETADDIATRYGIDIDKENIKESVTNVQNNINIVPKSFCKNIIIGTVKPIIIILAIISVCGIFLFLSLDAYFSKSKAKQTITIGLESSDGWKLIGPICNQLRLPR